MRAYIYQAALLCERCGKAKRAELVAPADVDDERSFDSDDYPKGPFEDGGGEADAPQHCDHCGAFLENPLTRDGVRYVMDECIRRVESRDRSVAWQEWAPFYGMRLMVTCDDESEEV